MNNDLTRFLFLTHVAFSLLMVGLIWCVQVVHYPLFAQVGRAEFPTYEQAHTRRITWLVAAPMLIEGVTAVLLFWCRPAGVPYWSLWTGVILLGMIWLSTALIQVPCHEILSRSFDSEVHRRLVSTNWIRTFCWSLRGLLVLWMAWNSLILK